MTELYRPKHLKIYPGRYRAITPLSVRQLDQDGEPVSGAWHEAGDVFSVEVPAWVLWCRPYSPRPRWERV